jgi:hypothetical protein
LTVLIDTPAVDGDAPRSMGTFIVQATRDAGGRLRGIVQRAKTGEKQRFTSAEGLGELIDRMLRGDGPRAQAR